MKSIFNEEHRDMVSKLKSARLSKGLSQAELSEKLERSQSYISKVEQGQIRLDVIQLKEISKVLGVDIKSLID